MRPRAELATEFAAGVFGVLVSYPGSSGEITDIRPIIDAAKAAGVGTVVATDLDDDLLTFALVDAPDGATIDVNTGGFTWTPTFDQGPGRYPITVIVTDDDTPALNTSAVFTVTVLDLPLTYDQAVTTD